MLWRGYNICQEAKMSILSLEELSLKDDYGLSPTQSQDSDTESDQDSASDGKSTILHWILESFHSWGRNTFTAYRNELFNPQLKCKKKKKRCNLTFYLLQIRVVCLGFLILHRQHEGQHDCSWGVHAGLQTGGGCSSLLFYSKPRLSKYGPHPSRVRTFRLQGTCNSFSGKFMFQVSYP